MKAATIESGYMQSGSLRKHTVLYIVFSYVANIENFHQKK